MGKGFTQLEELYKLTQQSNEIDLKKRALQHKCCHKDRKGRYTIKPVDGKNYVFKCKQCKAKLNLSIMDEDNNGPMKEQLKNATKTLKSAFDLFKLQADVNKDKKLIDFAASTMNSVLSMRRLFKKVICREFQPKKKKNRYTLNVSSGGRSLVH